LSANQFIGGTGSAIGSAGLVVNGTSGDNDSQLILKKPAQASFGVLAGDGAVYLSANIYYENGGWVQSSASGDNNNQLFVLDPGGGVRWYASNNGSASWNVASDLQLWNDSGTWQRPLSNTLTLNTSGTGLSGSTTFNNSGAATFTVTSNATNANTVSTIVARDASGNFSAGALSLNQILMPSTVSSAVDTQPTALSYGRLQGYGTFNINADTDASGAEFLILTAGYTVANATAANGLSIGQASTALTWRNNTVWHAGNDGSGSGLDADLLDGLNLHTGRNNEANKVVRTDANGYIQCGYLNSSNGNEGNNSSPARVWGTNGSDDYLRTYLTSALSAGYSINYTQSFNSNWNTDFQAAPAGSTILRGDTSTGSSTGGPGGSWWFQQNMRHTNASNYWGVQVAWGWEDNANRLKTRNITGGSYGSWVTYWNDNNDGAGSGLDADLLDGLSSGSFLRSDTTTTWSGSAGGIFQVTLPASASGATAGQVNTLQLYQGTLNADAFLSFHVSGDYAAHFGLDGTTNDLFYGGWSVGGTKYRVWHAANDGASSGLDADLLDGQHGSYYQDAGNLNAGTVPTARLASGTANATTYLRGDQTWASISGGATLSNDTTTNATYYPTFANATSGTYSTAYVSNTKCTFNPSTGTLSATIFTSLSDITQKKNIQKITNSTTLIKQISGVRFDWKDSDESSAGVIAQDVEKVLPEIIHTNDEGIKSVNYNGIIGLLVEAIKEQQNQIEELKSQINKS
jgi:uncharacterized protein YunC (DUF1805 family)